MQGALNQLKLHTKVTVCLLLDRLGPPSIRQGHANESRVTPSLGDLVFQGAARFPHRLHGAHCMVNASHAISGWQDRQLVVV